jgi:SAM-dependent methyltransferase
MTSPKLNGIESGPSGWYPYYAGFSERFALDNLSSAEIGVDDWVLDPWNGSGTTTASAVTLGLNVFGYDLNPVMVLAAKARCLDFAEYSSIKPLGSEILKQSRRMSVICEQDPLHAWFRPESAHAIRRLDASIQKLLVDNDRFSLLKSRGVDGVSDIAAFFYVALFRSVRELLRPYLTSNPTWVRRPRSKRSRLRPDANRVRRSFERHFIEMLAATSLDASRSSHSLRAISTASSESLPLDDASVSYVLSSPPYCTRLDYAVSTSPELAILGYGFGSDFDTLRRQMIGTPTVPQTASDVEADWGLTCQRFLSSLKSHASKASATYYFKNHVQYFRSIAASVSEISRVLKPSGRCMLVVQDSYYKDVHNDLASIITEMSEARGLCLRDRLDFRLRRTMAGINPGASRYRTTFDAVESALLFEATSMPTH